MIWNIFLLILMALTAATQWWAQREYNMAWDESRLWNYDPDEKIFPQVVEIRRNFSTLWRGCLVFQLVLMCMFV